MRISSNKMTNRHNESIDLDRISEELIELGNTCKQYCMNDIASSNLTKRILNLTRFIRKLIKRNDNLPFK